MLRKSSTKTLSKCKTSKQLLAQQTPTYKYTSTDLKQA